MKRSRSTEAQAVKMLKRHAPGISLTEPCKEHSAGAATLYNWKGKYGGMDAPRPKHLKEMGAGLSRYEQMYAEPAHQDHALKDLMGKKPWGRPTNVLPRGILAGEHQLSLRMACMVLCPSTSVHRYRPKGRDGVEIAEEPVG